MQVILQHLKSKANPDALFDSTANIAALAEKTEFERVGSLIYWEFPDKETINHQHCDIKDIFKTTRLIVEPVGFSEAIRRFAESVCAMHGTLCEGKNLSYLLDKDKSNPGYYFVVFYTGKVDDKKNTNFIEHGKVWIGDCGANMAFLGCSAEFLIKTHSELKFEFEKHWLITYKDIMQSLGTFANEFGYRFNQHGGHYFIPHKYTEDLYKIKKILLTFNQKLSITPIIAGCDEDIEEIINLLGNSFKQDLEKAEKQLFELCIHAYGFQYHWEDYVDSAMHRDIDGLKANKISKTRYGRKLTEKILKIEENASDTEYKKLVEGYLSSIKPNKNKSVNKLYAIKNDLVNAIQKLNAATESRLINKWRNQMLEDLYQVNTTLGKTSEILLDELLSVL